MKPTALIFIIMTGLRVSVELVKLDQFMQV